MTLMNPHSPIPDALADTMAAMGRAARAGAQALGSASSELKDRAIRAAAAALRERRSEIAAANQTDMREAARKFDFKGAAQFRDRIKELRAKAALNDTTSIA